MCSLSSSTQYTHGLSIQAAYLGCEEQRLIPLLRIQTLGLNLSTPKYKETIGWKDVSMPSPLFPSQPVTALRPVDRSVPTNLSSRSKAARILLPPKTLRKPQKYFPTAVRLTESQPALGERSLRRSPRRAVCGERRCGPCLSALGGAVACGEAAAAQRGGGAWSARLEPQPRRAAMSTADQGVSLHSGCRTKVS